jgi:hypothetical protein
MRVLLVDNEPPTISGGEYTNDWESRGCTAPPSQS